MVWKKNKNKLKHHEEVWRYFFCLKPREVKDGYYVWMTYCERRYWYDEVDDKLHKTSEFRLTKSQKEKLGVVW